MYDLHSLHGQFSGSYFLISFLKACNNVSSLNSVGTIFHIFGPRNEKLLEVKVDNKLNFNEHLDGIIKKASRKVSALSRIFPQPQV